MLNEEHLIKIFEYALNQEETGKSFSGGIEINSQRSILKCPGAVSLIL